MSAAALALAGLATATAGAGTLGASWVGVMRAGGGPPRGLAPAFDVHREMSAAAVRRTGLHTRPDLRVTRRTPVREVGTHLARTARGRAVYASLEDVTLTVAGPRKGKTGGLIAPAIVDAPGAVLATSTKTDVHALTAPYRSGPLWVMNPDRIGSLPSSVVFDLTVGCEDPDTCDRRAGYLLGATADGGLGISDAAFWEGTAHAWLRCALHAARLDGRSMSDVATWSRDLGNPTPRRILDRAGGAAPPGWADELGELAEAPDRTRQSIGLTIKAALGFMSLPAARDLVCPPGGRGGFDVERFIDDAGTLYLLGRDRKNSTVAPLFAALAGHVVDEGRRIAQNRGGRLERPMLGALDEAANVCRVPLAEWTSDCGSHGIPLLIAVQSVDQLAAAWGDTDADIVWGNATTKVMFGGASVAGRLRDLTTLAGEKVERLNDRHHRVPVLTPADIHALPRGRVLVLRGGVGAVLGDVAYIWDRRDEPWRESGARREPSGPLAPIIRLADRRRARSAA